VGETGLAGDTPGDMLLAFTFNTSSHAWALSSTETSYTKGDVQQVFVQNGLIWTIESNGGPSTGNLQTWTYSVPNFTLKATATGLNGYDYMAGDGTYVYVADQGNGLKAYQGSGTTLTKLSTTPYKPSGGDITAVFAQGGKIIVSDAGNCNTLALTYSGGASFALSSTLTGVCNMGQDSYGNASDFPSITGDGTYIYIADTTNVGFATANVYAYTLSGTTWTKVGTLAGAASGYFEPNFVFASSAQPGIVYVQSVLENCPVCAFPSSSVFSYSFNGSTFTFNGTLPTYAQFGPVLPQYTDGSYLYYPDTPWDWAMAFPVCR
jgi:hypothetical protein